MFNSLPCPTPKMRLTVSHPVKEWSSRIEDAPFTPRLVITDFRSSMLVLVDKKIFHLFKLRFQVISIRITKRSVSSPTTVTLHLVCNNVTAVLQISTSASDCAFKQLKPDRIKYSERRSMHLCLFPGLLRNRAFLTVRHVDSSTFSHF